MCIRDSRDHRQRRRHPARRPGIAAGEQAQPLAKQALRYLYRILFLLYAEASPELEVLPVNVQEYDRGYSLDRLRELVQVRLGNVALQQVLGHLLLSKEKRGQDRGFISYAELGIDQLGAVYEGLMSYTGFFAETDLYEVAKGGDGSKGSWVVPTDRIDGISEADFIREPDPQTGEPRPVLHPRGSFVFRLAGRGSPVCG